MLTNWPCRKCKEYQIACNWSPTSIAADRLSMNFQTSWSSLLSPASNPCESWKIKLLPAYVIWSSISCMPRWKYCILILITSVQFTHLHWWCQMHWRKFWLSVSKGNPIFRWRTLPSSSTPFWSYMMGFVPFATPQTFSRMVVLPALALPMMRMRKWRHLYRSLSTLTEPSIWWEMWWVTTSKC